MRAAAMINRATTDALPALRPELARLVELGHLARAEASDGARPEPCPFSELALDAARRGELTPAQIAALAALLGLAPPALAAND
jgi:hypothetical protein